MHACRSTLEDPTLHPLSKNYLEPAEYTLAEALGDGGYRTALIGKWHLGVAPAHWPEEQGFDEAWHCHPDSGPPSYFSPYGVMADVRAGKAGRFGTISDGPPGEYIVDRQAEEAARFIAASKDQPFFLLLSCYGVHGPWGHKPEYTAAFAEKRDPRGVQGNPIMASMLKSVDECLGRVLATLDEHGLTDDTIVLFYSDNGGNVDSNAPGSAKTGRVEQSKPEFLADWRRWAGDRPPTDNSPLREGKGSLYEGGTRVPMMWSWPGHIPAGQVSDAVVGHIDVYPTLLDLVGLPSPPQQRMDGISIAPVLRGEGSLARRAFFNYLPHQPKRAESAADSGSEDGESGDEPEDIGGASVVRGGLKLIRWFHPDRARELYDLDEDLGETRNLAAEKPEAVRELDALIAGFLADTGALLPQPNPGYRGAGKRRPERGDDPDPLGGWRPVSVQAEALAGRVRLTGAGRLPMLTISGLKHAGPVVLGLRTRGAGGRARIQWRTRDQAAFPETGQAVEVTLAAGEEWSEARVELPVQGSLMHLRLHLPLESGALELDWVRVDSAGNQQRWEFGGPAQ